MQILVIAPSWIGDTMISHSLYQLLIQRHHNIKIDVITNSWCYELFQYMPEINQLITTSFDHGILALKQRYKLGKAIKQNKCYQQALILPNSFKSALIPYFANIACRTGWRGEMRYGLINDIRILNKQDFPLMVQRYAALAFDRKLINTATDLPITIPWPKITIKKETTQKTLNVFLLNNQRPIIGLCPGAEFGSIKCWPYYHYATLAKTLIESGYHVVMLGSIKDIWIGQSITDLLSKNHQLYYNNLIGKTTLTQAIDIINFCHAIVSNDSGLMHITSALSRPLIALYGPTNPEFTPPLSHKFKIIRLIHNDYKIHASNNKLDYHYSLIAIKPIQVIYELENLLKKLKNA